MSKVSCLLSYPQLWKKLSTGQPLYTESPNMTHHQLKIQALHWQALNAGIKTHEIRLNDRNYQTGDTLTFTTPDGTPHPGTWTITHILTHHQFPQGLNPGYALLSLKKTN